MYIYFVLLYLLLFKNALSEDGTNVASPRSFEFVAEINVGDRDHIVELVPTKICRENGDDYVCRQVRLDGDCRDLIPKDSQRAFKIVTPLIYDGDAKGYCTVHVHSWPVNDSNNIDNKEIVIQFDTSKVDNLDETQNFAETPNENDPGNTNAVVCKVGCNETQSTSHVRSKRCVYFNEQEDEEDNDVFYETKSNDDNISKDDLEFIKSLDPKARTTKDILIINKNTDVNESKQLCPHCNKLHVVIDEQKTINFNKQCSPLDKLKSYFQSHKYTFLAFGLIISVQCLFVLAMIYCLIRFCDCAKERKVVRHYFNYRQDASVTTPLICTSNNGTETTDCNLTEKSIPDRNGKCYEACGNESKFSITDDVLSKCINRRNWERSATKDEDKPKTDLSRMQIEQIDTRVTFETETINSKPKSEDENEAKINVDNIENRHVQCDLSEREINCHTYMCKEKKNKSRFGFFKSDRSKAENSAQAAFSNDSLDDFLSQRLKRDNGSNITSLESRSSLSSRTSKNLRGVKSFFSKKSKTSSVPGVPSKKSINLEVLHMSRVSGFLSSSDHFKLAKDSRTSL
ncbi:uncharacterized protein LOC101743677 [Bombyx mori]|uniref:Uncharacterized protein n=1 Tax=Bombyx mori TaxID=7091 RepID=A0A8R2ALX5_BOMMO|nr:uncharacterized protein LOC101743677 [Bombyx mori]